MSMDLVARLLRLRHRLARFVVGGAFVRLTETGTWMVTYDAKTDMTIAMRVAEWSGSLTTRLQPLEYGTGDVPQWPQRTTTGEFRGTFDVN